MNNTLKRIIRLVLDRFPSALPVGMAAFEVYITSLFADYSLPDNPSHRHALAANIMRLGLDKSSVPRYHFVRVLRRAQAGEIAWEVMQRLEKAEADRQEKLKAEAKAQVDADALLKAAANNASIVPKESA